MKMMLGPGRAATATAKTVRAIATRTSDLVFIRIRVIRVQLTKASHTQSPRLAIFTRQVLRRGVIAFDLFRFGVPHNPAARAQRNVSEQTGAGRAMADLDVRDRRLPRLDAIEEIADVRVALPVTAFHTLRLEAFSASFRDDFEKLPVDVKRGVRAVKQNAVALPVQ